MNDNIEINAIVAMAENYVIGDGNGLIWDIPEDLQRLKKITMGYPLIMGRKTWESIGFNLPGRLSVVLTKSKDWKNKGTINVNSFEEAFLKSYEWLEHNKNLKTPKIFLFGGGQIFKGGLRYVTKIYLTRVFLNPKGDVFFPKLNEKEWKETNKSEIKISNHGIKFQFLELLKYQ